MLNEYFSPFESLEDVNINASFISWIQGYEIVTDDV